jgi:predicted transcriptional regulator
VGRGYVYYPLIKKTEYSNQSLQTLVDGYFGGSFNNMVSFFMKKNDVDMNELESILQQINDKKTEK